jgi:hypothetical protein
MNVNKQVSVLNFGFMKPLCGPLNDLLLYVVKVKLFLSLPWKHIGGLQVSAIHLTVWSSKISI